MKPSSHLLFMSLSLALSLGFFVPASQAADSPNIILILVDDLERGSVGCYGANQATPNIDQLANTGVRYETAWSMPVCTPNRVTLLTGQYPFRHGWTQHYDVAQLGGQGLSWQRFTTMAKLLREGGYETAIGGHWQINDLGKQPDALNQHGFQEYCVWADSAPKENKNDTRERHTRLLVNGKLEKTLNRAGRINSFLIDFATRNRNQPFFIYYPMLLESVPPSESKNTKTLQPLEQINLQATRIARMDQLIGNLINAIDVSGQQKETMILLTGTNISTVENRILEDENEQAKSRASDHSVRVPLIVHGPAVVSGGRVSRDLVDFTDFYPTLLELAGLRTPDQLSLDGKSLVPSLRGSENPYQKRSWIYSQVGDIRMIRDWEHLIDTSGNFHNLLKDPLQQNEVSPLDKIAPGRRQRLQMLMDRLPEDADSPFPEYTQHHSNK